jgi:hypothetical protein
MITFSKLGKFGRLGNQMFQYATTLSVADYHNFDFAMPAGPKLMEFENLSCKLLVDPSQLSDSFHERGFGFDPEVFLVSDNTDLYGYFQSPKYFSTHRERLKHEFKFSNETIHLARKIVAQSDICAIHVRGGDYLTQDQYHATCTSAYYKQAMQDMRSHGFKQFLVFSDDLVWAKALIQANHAISFHSSSTVQDLCAMTLCDGHIIANSSYSWWGAYLSESRRVIAPARWFGVLGPKRWQDIYCQEWAVM